MIPVSLQASPHFDRKILSIAAKIVPSSDRAEWLKAWQAELWHMHDRCRGRHARETGVMADFSIGILRDALWLRTESWRCSLSGSAILCLASLLGLSLISIGFALLLEGSWQLLNPHFIEQSTRSLFAAPIVVFVASAIAARRHTEHGSINRKMVRLKRLFFFIIKTVQVLLLAFLLSVDACNPMHWSFPHAADLLQLFCFVSFSLLGLRWTFNDQEQRCKECLQTLETPSRVGRPSHNLLEWNGTELNCKSGHGLLSVPEIETSWCQSSQWVVTRSE